MKDYGDNLAQQVDLRIHDAVVDTTHLIAMPASERDPNMLIAIQSSSGAQLAIWRADSIATVDNLFVFVPTDISTGAAYISDPTTAPGRYHIIASGGSVSSGIQKATVTVAYNNTTLAAASSNGASASVNIGSALPANARIAGVCLRSLTPFTGGGATSVALDVGSAGDPIAIVSGADVHSAAVDGYASTQPAGKAPHKDYASSTQLLARFTPDGSHALSGLTAGSVIVDVLYWVLA